VTAPAALTALWAADGATAVPPGLTAAVTRVALAAPAAGAAVSATWLTAALVVAGVGTVALVAAAGAARERPEEGQTRVAQVPGPPENPPPAAPRVDAEGVPLPPGVLARLGSSRMRHAGNVYAVTFAPDGRTLASAARDGVRVWDVATGRLTRQLIGPWNYHQTLRFAADGRELLVLRGNDAVRKTPGSVYRFDVATGRELFCEELKADGAVPYTLTISPSGQQFALGMIDPAVAAGPGRARVHIHDAATGRETLRIPVDGIGARDVDFAPDDRTLAVADLRDTVRLHDATNGRLVGELKHDGVQFILARFSPDGRSLATLAGVGPGQPNIVEFWDVAARAARVRLPLPGLPERDALTTHHVAFSPDGRFLATCSQSNYVLLWDVATGKEARRFRCLPSVMRMAFSPDGQTLAAASNNGTITLWDVESGQLLPASADPIVLVCDLRYVDGGRRLIGAADGLLVWDPITGRPVAPPPTLTPKPDHGFLLSDGRLITGQADGAIHVWDAATGKEVHVLRAAKPFVWQNRFGFTGTRLVATDADKVIHLFDLTDGRLLRTAPAGVEWVTPLAISSDGKWLAFANRYARPGADRNIRVWDLAELREVRRLTPRGAPVVALAFSPDGGRLASAGGEWQASVWRGGVQLWDVETGKELRAYDGHTAPVECVAWSGDGRALATGGLDSTVRVWEAVTGGERLQFTGHAGQIDAIAFAPDGRTLAASSPEAPVYVWDVLGLSEFAGRAPTAAELDPAWTALAGGDAKAAFAAIRRLVAAPDQAVHLLKDRLPPAAAVDPQQVRAAIRRLDSAKFADRQAAATELEALGERAAAELRAALKDAPSAEVRAAVQRLLDRIEAGTPAALRAIRAVEVLEYIATPAAREHLRVLAGGQPGAELTTAAAEALRRLEKR
jgi:WD40 repeat protein